MMEMLEWLGRKTLGIFDQLGAIILLFVAAVKQLPKMRRSAGRPMRRGHYG